MNDRLEAFWFAAAVTGLITIVALGILSCVLVVVALHSAWGALWFPIALFLALYCVHTWFAFCEDKAPR